MAFGFLKKIGGGIFKGVKAGVTAGASFVTSGNPLAAARAGFSSLTGRQRSQIAATSFPVTNFPMPVPSYGYAPPTAPPPGSLGGWMEAIKRVVNEAKQGIQTARTIAATDPKILLAQARQAAGGLGAVQKLQENLPLILIAVVVIVLIGRRA